VITQVVRQFGRPRGVTGRLAGWLMAYRGSNRQRNLWVVSLLVETLQLNPPVACVLATNPADGQP
jgi:hypothetical protein